MGSTDDLLPTAHSAPHTPHSLPPLFPQFLTKRRRGWSGLAAILAESGLSRPAFFLLREVAGRGAAGGTIASLRPGAPYATRDTHLLALDEAVVLGFLARDETGRYQLTKRGWATVVRAEREATAYLAALQPLPAVQLARLAERLAEIAAGLAVDPGDADAHLARSRRLADLAPESAAAPLVRIERAVLDLWMARDDAHIAAWRHARFPGPALDVLTRLWRGDADALPALYECLASTHAAADVDDLLDELIEQGYVEWRRGELQPTRAGYEVREHIEADTDERYFASWPRLDSAEIAWLYALLGRLVEAVGGTSPTP